MCSDSRAHTRGLVTARNSGVGLAVRTHMDCVRCVCRTARYLRSDDHCTANASQRRLMIHQMDDLLTACNSNCNSLLRSKLELSNQHACPCLRTLEALVFVNEWSIYLPESIQFREFDKTLAQPSFLSTFECSHKNCFPKFFNIVNRKTSFVIQYTVM